MTPESVVFWIFAVAWLVVIVVLVFVLLPRTVREASRLVKRILALTSDASFELQIAKAEADVNRIEAALDRIPALRRRAQLAIDLIRGTPLVPPAIAALAERVRREIRAFRQASG